MVRFPGEGAILGTEPAALTLPLCPVGNMYKSEHSGFRCQLPVGVSRTRIGFIELSIDALKYSVAASQIQRANFLEHNNSPSRAARFGQHLSA